MKEYEQIIKTAKDEAVQDDDLIEFAYLTGINDFIKALGNCVPEGLIVSALNSLKLEEENAN